MSFNDVNFGMYIYRVLKQVHPDTGMSGDGLSTVNNLVRILLQKIVRVSNQLMINSAGRKTVSSKEIQTAVRLALPGELAKHGVSEGTKAVTKYLAKKGEKAKEPGAKKGDGTKAKPVSRASLADITFPVTRVETVMMELSNAERKSETAAVYLAAVLEYLIAEVLELAGNAARDNKKVRITPRHITLAIRNDAELDKLFQNVVLGGGVLPHIEPALIKNKGDPDAPKKSKRSVKKPATKKPATKKADGKKQNAKKPAAKKKTAAKK